MYVFHILLMICKLYRYFIRHWNIVNSWRLQFFMWLEQIRTVQLLFDHSDLFHSEVIQRKMIWLAGGTRPWTILGTCQFLWLPKLIDRTSRLSDEHTCFAVVVPGLDFSPETGNPNPDRRRWLPFSAIQGNPGIILRIRWRPKIHIFWEVSVELIHFEDGGSNVLRNVANDLPIDMAKHPRCIFCNPAVRSLYLWSPQFLPFAFLSYIRLPAGQPRSRGRDRYASYVRNNWSYTSIPSWVCSLVQGQLYFYLIT
jgi:hypothetical protein